MGDFLTRLGTIIVGAAFALFMMLYNVYTLCLFFTAIMLVCLFEFHVAIGDTVGKLYSGSVSFAIYSLIVAHSFEWVERKTLILILPLTSSLFAFEILAKAKFSFRNVGLGLICVAWIAVPFALCTTIVIDKRYEGDYNPYMMIGIMIITWFNDAGAYCVGKLGGRTPLHPELSPKKTWEGTIGGAIISFIAGDVVRRYLTFLPHARWIEIMAICVFCGSIGDLIESMFKRSIRIKDTGKLLPGHGGLLDRFDAIFYAVPFIFTYLVWIDYIQ